MSIFWKIFLSILTATTLLFTVGGNIMVHTIFRSSLTQEIYAVQSDNLALRVALATAVSNDPHSGDISPEALGKLAGDLQIITSSGDFPFAVSGENYDTLFSSGGPMLDSDTAKSLPDYTESYTIRQTDGRYYVIDVSKTTLENQMLYLQNYRDITAVFQQKDNLYSIFQNLLIALIVIIIAIILALSMWIVRPIKRLSGATRQIAAGDFSKRVKITGHDEISTLSQDFNTMADHLEDNITELKNAVRRQEDFVGNFAHELKTPLTSIIGYADMLRSKQLSAEEQFTYADYIFREGRRLEALSRKLMEIIVLEQDKLETKPVSVRYLLENVCGSVDPMLKKANIALSVRVEDAMIPMEFDLMKTVLFNLIDNSRKALPHGGAIQITGQRNGDHYRLEVTDNGPGIPAEELSKITEAFYMVDKSRAREQGGAGLGLALCARIIQMHGGTLEFTSQPGTGTTAILSLKEEGQ